MAELTPAEAILKADISLSAYSFAHPLAMGLLAMRSKANRVNITDTTGNVSTFLSRMAFYDYTGACDPHGVPRPERDQTIEIRRTSDLDAVLTRLRRLLKGDSSLRTIELILVELSGNVDLHAQAEGIILGQVIRGKLELAVVDSGVGIRQSLSANPKYGQIDEQSALRLCVQKGVTSGSGRGWGLWSAYEVLRQNQGEMTIGSGGFRYVLSKNKVLPGPTWVGTYVELKYDLSKPVDYSQATGMAKGYKVKEEDEDDFPF